MTTASSMTYDSLVLDIQTYAERDDSPFTTQIPRFIMMAENRIAMEIKGLGYEKVVSTTLSSTGVYAKPSRWRETISVNGTTSTGQRYPLYERTYEYLRSYWPDETVLGKPKYYADYDYEHYLIVPTPAADSGQIEIRYYERPEPLSSSNQVNWTTQYAPQLLLYACLLEAQPFLKLDERVQVFQAMFDRASQSLQIEDKRRMSDRNASVKA
jgi:hypothetical protein